MCTVRLKLFFKKVVKILELGGISLLIGKIAYRLILVAKPLIPRKLFQRMEFKCKVGYWPRLNHPRSLNEKVFLRKIMKPHPLAAIVADKWRVRQYVAEKQLGHILNVVSWVGENPENIPFENLPEKFVIKATHGSGWNIIIYDKHKCDTGRIISKCKEWLNLKFSNYWNETHYDEISPKIMIEEFIEDRQNNLPVDFKFFCFHGRVEVVKVDSGRDQEHKINFYTREWLELPFSTAYFCGGSVKKPGKINEMIVIAEKISEDFDFCRVDLYSPNDERILFGEVTLTPGAGLNRFYPLEWDFRLGQLWHLEKGFSNDS